ncbi:MAG: hypothetical protein P4L51_08955 [Puia sp.]|nr:hypothetical protein [Puia sp.]
MKKLAIFGSLFFLLSLSSCIKDNFNYPQGTVAGYKIIYFPSIAINGSKFQVVIQGTSPTDSGATAVLDGAPVQYTTSMTITNQTSAGIYNVVYTAANPQGYTASDFRVVVVVPASVAADPVVGANDFSGTYLRAATGVTSTWTKIGPGVYTVQNPGGAAGAEGLYAILTNYSGNDIEIPSQSSLYFNGTISTSGAVYKPTPAPASYSWVFNAPNYGTSVRKFVEQ